MSPGRSRSLHGTHSGRAGRGRQQHRLVEGDELRARGTGDGDGPAPAAVPELLALEVVRDNAVPRNETSPTRSPTTPAAASRRRCARGRRPRRTGGRGAASRCRCAHRYRFSPGCRHGCAIPRRECGRSGPVGRVDVHARSHSGAPTSSILRDDREARGREQPPQARYARYLLLSPGPHRRGASALRARFPYRSQQCSRPHTPSRTDRKEPRTTVAVGRKTLSRPRPGPVRHSDTRPAYGPSPAHSAAIRAVTALRTHFSGQRRRSGSREVAPRSRRCRRCQGRHQKWRIGPDDRFRPRGGPCPAFPGDRNGARDPQGDARARRANPASGN